MDTPEQTTSATGVTGVTGKHTTDGIPHGRTSLTPFLALRDPSGALRFYEEAFGARIGGVTEMGGIVVHAVLDFGNGRLEIGAVNPEYGLVAMPDGDDDCYSMGLYCSDVDAVVARAVALGATVREATTTFVSGDRYASLRDPFGVRWSVMTRVEDLSDSESDRRVAEWAASR
ncbi:VOC family protein [Rhodococcus sp. IEGM 1408]|uniref:VOC family protein n=1 Tax=Rhodococcus sp. IEGM 1408 TaxID=3082220 RepID=UPI0029543A4C|nr:VOC family protein [Rhodococcus sp. IEGM 1408]MDV8000675.1 VOC family protein [Rhodococcus sp. IEGM 1408]